MKTIYKYPVPITDFIIVMMPKGAKILHVAEQFGVPHIWALVDNTEEMRAHEFAWRGTGHSCENVTADQYIGTVIVMNDSLVFHLFDLGE